MLVTAKSIKTNEPRWEEIRGRILAVFKKYFYEPILETLDLPDSTISNSDDEDDALIRAIARGRITFDRGVFRGRLSARVSRRLKELGATFDKKDGVFRLLAERLPPGVRTAIDTSEARFKVTLQKIDAHLESLTPAGLAEKVKTADIFNKDLWQMQAEVEKSLKGITVAPKLTESQADFIAREWSENLQLWIRNFTEEQISDLRQKVTLGVFRGDRQSVLAETIRRSYGVTESKAKFLARQETHLLMAKFKQARYTESGSTHYRWKTVAGSPAHPVRPSHKVLDNKIFRWDDPPVTTSPNEPQRRNNPGEDYNCRCYAIPVFKK